MKLGVILGLDLDIRDAFKKLADIDIHTCQLNCWDARYFTYEMAEQVREASKEFDIEITALWCGWSGPAVWDFYSGPATLGLVPSKYRGTRLKELKKGSDFAVEIGVDKMITHVGFIPEIPTSDEYIQLLPVLKGLAEYVKSNKQYFLFETGQETPVTLLRTIEEIGTGNLGINLDPANLILYGKANPVDALDVFGKYVMGVHGKDGDYPTDGKNLGEEKRIGDGKVNYPLFIQKLRAVGYDGAITIEREIHGEKQIEDIVYSKKYLEKLIKTI
ncbi:MAG: sugar phosphate isomerase/epimerase [Eubacteriales bacterium]|nr:sugar phosphate isomerase/epimerase [Eubacteriales bacterium]